MRIVHRISISATPADLRDLKALGVVVGAHGFVTFEVDEEHEQWSELEKWIQARRAVDIVSTKFSKQEIDDAEWLSLVPDWHYGYPQPEEDVFGFREATFDLTNYCKQCGMGMTQKAPFQMKSEPKWGNKSILQLNWVFDEYFVTPTIWASIFKPHGIGSLPVIDRNGIKLKTVVQLVVKEEVGIMTNGLLGEECPNCKHVKYLPITRGPFPSLLDRPSTTMAKTTEYFGSGASAYKGVLISRGLARILSEQKIRGASVKPVKNTRRNHGSSDEQAHLKARQG
jgi:hypothetical protein